MTDELQARLEALGPYIMPGNWSVDERAMSIWTDHLHGGKVIDIRGWGHLTGGGAMNLPADEAECIQRATAEMVCELVNAYRANALVPASALAEAQAKIEWFRVDNDKMLAGFVQAKLETKEAQAENSRLRMCLHEIDIEAGNTIPPDGGDAAFAALDRIVRLINPFRLRNPRAALGDAS